ncbi:MAG: metalloregulator ArsR/SmtB family transcription factor [bacterium]|nr:metalloregulator ArsR/SmtB family transcription factor [bacterium]
MSAHCDEFAFDPERVARVRSKTLGLPREVADLFKALGDYTRAHLAYALAHEELCVCDLAVLVGLSVSCVSHHLRLLRAMGLVKHRRSGRQVFYRLDDEHVHGILREGLEHVRHRREGGR